MKKKKINFNFLNETVPEGIIKGHYDVMERILEKGHSSGCDPECLSLDKSLPCGPQFPYL